MHNTLILLLAATNLAFAQDSLFSYSPRETTSDDNLATVTALSDGHLPTCFTNHPTHPCPTDGPDAKRDVAHDINNAAGQSSYPLATNTPEAAVVERDAPLRVSNKDYIPEPNEWAIPSNFTFTDTISQNATGTAATTARLTHASSTTASATPTPHSDSYLKSHNNYFNREDTYAKRMNASAAIESMKKEYMTPQGTAASAVHTILPTGDALVQSSNATTTTANSTGHLGTSTAIAPLITDHSTASINASSTAHLEGIIGTLLSPAMFPGKMRGPSTSVSQASASATTLAPSIAEHSIVPIPMSQSPNTTAPNASLQAFVHTINTENLAASQQTSSSTSILPAFASATPVAQKSEEVKSEQKLASSSQTAQHATEPSAAPSKESGEPKTGEKLHHYLHSVSLENPSANQAQEIATASSSISTSEATLEATPDAYAPRNDTQVVTRINSNNSVTLSQVQPTATPQAYKASAHHHPRARRFIS